MPRLRLSMLVALTAMFTASALTPAVTTAASNSFIRQLNSASKFESFPSRNMAPALTGTANCWVA
jgi:hypothetical protein